MAITNPFAAINASLPPLVPAPLPAPDFNALPSDAATELAAVPRPSSGRPQVFGPTAQDREQQMLSGRLERDYQKDLQPWGTPQNHPGVWGKIGHAISVATGGPNRRLMEETGLEKRLNALMTGQQENELRAAQAGEAKAREPLEAAQAEEAAARTKYMPEQLQAGLAEHGLRWNDEAGKIEQVPEAELSELQRAQVEAARNPWTKEAGNQPLGERVAQLNQAMTQRYQVTHPGAPLPPALTLPADATKNDFDRLDKMLQAEEAGAASQAQRDESNKFRQAMLALAQQREAESEETKGSKWVTWQDTNGRTIAGPRSEAKRLGVEDVADLQGQEIRDVQNARHVVTLLEKRGDPDKPETQGVLQLIDSLDRDGKLGVLASRYNRFVTSGVGASPNDDPRIITLIDKNMLADTGTMLAHFGASGGRSPQMLQHFLDLANSGKMDGVTLRAGAKAIDDYMKDRGMISEQTGGVVGAQPIGKTSKPDGTYEQDGKRYRVEKGNVYAQ